VFLSKCCTSKIFALVFSIIGFLFTTLGLEMILKIAVPLLTLIYPVSIALVLISFANMFSTFRFSWAYRLATVITLIISIINHFKITPCNKLKLFSICKIEIINVITVASR
jgi:LIVCS family branched-chain amino acid:cation transporter